MMVHKVGVAVIGCGGISDYHIPALLQVENADLRVLCDANPERAARQARRYRIPKCVHDVKEVWKRDDIQAVLVLAPNPLHHELTIQAAAAGKHVMVQKPFARTPEEAKAMIKAAKDANVLLVPSFMHRFMDETIMAKDYIQKGYIGRPMTARVRNGVPGAVHASWFFNPKENGGGAVIDIGVHGIDLFRYLVGEPIEVAARIGTYRPERRLNNGQVITLTAEDTGVVLYRFDNGALGTQDISWSQVKGSDRFSAEIYGDEGTIYLRSPMGQLAIASKKMDPRGAWVMPDLPGHSFGYVQHKSFIDAVAGIAPSPVLPEDGLATISIVMAIYRSAQEGRFVTV